MSARLSSCLSKPSPRKRQTFLLSHNFPSPVRLGMAWDTKGAIMSTFKTVFKVLGPIVYMLTVEAGECHVFSRKISQRARVEVQLLRYSWRVELLLQEESAARLEVGYSVDSQGECAESSGRKGAVEQVWKRIVGKFKRITGLEAA
jgi:hypothetical protein